MYRFTFAWTIVVTSLACVSARSAEVTVLTPESWEEFAPAGKEVDCVYGDFVLRTADWTAVIARPIDTRNSNMTVKGVGACLIDFTSRKELNDQLSAYYPGSTRHTFTTPANIRILVDGQAVEQPEKVHAQGKVIVWECTSDLTAPKSDDKPPAGTKPEDGKPTPQLRMVRRYTAEEGKPYLLVETIYSNPHDSAVAEKMGDLIRADRVFTFGDDNDGELMWVQDDWFRQTYGIAGDGFRFVPVKKGNNFDFAGADAELKLPAGASKTFARQLYCGESLIAVRALQAQQAGKATQPYSVSVNTPLGPAAQAKLTFTSKDTKQGGSARTNAQGEWSGSLPAGDYDLEVNYLGQTHSIGETKVSAMTPKSTVDLATIGAAELTVTDDQGKPIPCKVAFFLEGAVDQDQPDFGPDSGEVAVKNLYYSHNGKFTQQLYAGKYDVLVSYGPEYDVATLQLVVQQGKTATASAKLKRSVDTAGWISADYHNHASPSGDNVSSQRGRVLNLLCEHIEFAPCTEHNRVDSYVPHLMALDVMNRMATCTGIELTGSPLPVNHQNAFPLIHKPRTQDGGGPTPAVDPVVQIERLSMWDGGSDKLVQMNHPNLPQILGDKDLDGQMDAGFEKMFRFTDVIEIHPIESIFDVPEKGVDYKKYRNPSLAWLQMLNVGYRIPGVVNTDAHYNFHGSGWMRNYIQCSTDDPAKIETPEMIHQSEKGHLFMTTGPFLRVKFFAQNDQGTDKADRFFSPGDDVSLPSGKGELQVHVECANWLDINRVQVFLNGRPNKLMNYLRRENDSHFGDGVVKFDAKIPLEVKGDTHVVVACIGENLSLGRVFGAVQGKQVPVALTNPIFLDVDGQGFQPNGDLLDAPLMFDKASPSLHK